LHLGPPLPVQGQLCFVNVTFHNDSPAGSLTAPFAAVLFTGERQFDVEFAFPIQPVYVFPDAQRKMMLAFDIPREATPTKVRISYLNHRSVYYRLG
jgi:hypothetical protein